MLLPATFQRTARRTIAAAAVALAAVFGSAAAPAPAQAFTNEVPPGTATLRLNQIPSLQSFLNAIGAGAFGNTEIASATVTDRSISGTINMLAWEWNFLLFKAGTAGSESFIALEPRRTFRLSEMFDNVPGMSLIDVLQFDRQVLVFAARDSELQESALPPEAAAFFRPYFGSSVMNVNFSGGMTMYAALDLGKVGVLRDAIQFIGGQSSVVRLRAAMTANILSQLAEKKKPVPSLQFAAALPTVRPRIGNLVELPADFTIGFQAELSPINVKMGYLAETNFPFAYPNIATKNISTARTAMGLEVSMELGVDSPLPTFAVQATMFKGAQNAFRQAFGIPFLTLQDYVVSFEQSADALAVGVGAGGKFYDKNIETFASLQVRASTSGLPIPQKLKFMVTPDNPSQIASLSLTDLGRAFVDLTSTIAGQRITLPAIPDNFVRISGMRAGEGPFLDATLDLGLDFGLEAAGNLVVFGKQMAEVEKAVVKPTHGVEIKAKNSPVGLGDIIRMPSAEIDVALTVDNLTDPRVRIKGTTQELLGSVGIMEVSINKDRQIGIVEGHAPFNMFAATLIVESDTRQFDRPNFSATGIIEGDWFNKLADGLTNATADLVKGTESVVKAMNEEVHTFSQKLTQARIDKSKAVSDLEAARRSVNAEFQKAQNEVNKLQREYNYQSGECSPAPWDWDHCVAAGSIWVALQTARGVLSVAQRAVDAFLRGTGAALSGIIDGLNATINSLGQAIDVASQALGRAAVTFTKALDIAAKIAGKALEAVAAVFDIDKVWMQGQLAILQGQQRGELGIQYTMMSREYLKSVNWDFRVPVEDIVKVFKPGSQGSPAPVVIETKYSFAPTTTQAARDVSNQLINEGQLRAVTVPFDPNVCVKEPYAIDRQLADLRTEKDRIGNLRLNAQAYAYVLAAEGSNGFKNIQSMLQGAGGLSWANPGAQGMVIGGQEPGRQLPICRASYAGGAHPGKLVAGNCNIGYGGREIVLPPGQYQVLVGSGVRWVGASGGQVPQGAFIGGQEPGRQLPICRAQHAGGVHPGKLVAQNCNIGYGGREILVRNYEVLVAGTGWTPYQTQVYTAIVNSYRSMKTLTAERTFTPQRVEGLRNAVTTMSNNINQLAANDYVRVEIGNFIARPSAQQANLNPQFLGTQDNELTATIAALEKLRRDPASPCGKAAQQAGVQAPASPQPAGQASSRGFGNLGGLFQQLQQQMQQAAQQAQQAVQQAQQQAQQAAQQQQQQAGQPSAFAVAAAAAAMNLAQQQKTAAQQVADTAKKQQALAFVEKLKQHKAKADKAAEDKDKVANRLDQIKSVKETANQQKLQQLAAEAAAAAQKAANAARIQQVQPKPPLRPATAPGVVPRPPAATAARGVGPAQPQQQAAVVFTPKPLMHVSPAVRAAFAREFAAEQASAQALPAAGAAPQARGTAPVAAQAPVGPQQQQRLATARAASVQNLQATPAAKGLPANLQPNAVLGSEAKADPIERAALLKATTRVVGRQSQIPGSPDSVATQASGLPPDQVPLSAHIANDYLKNLSILREIPR